MSSGSLAGPRGGASGDETSLCSSSQRNSDSPGSACAPREGISKPGLRISSGRSNLGSPSLQFPLARGNHDRSHGELLWPKEFRSAVQRDCSPGRKSRRASASVPVRRAIVEGEPRGWSPVRSERWRAFEMATTPRLETPRPGEDRGFEKKERPRSFSLAASGLEPRLSIHEARGSSLWA